MTFQEWQKLLRKSKNNRDFHKLKTAIFGYFRGNKIPYDIVNFYYSYNYSTVECWYLDAYETLKKE